MKGPNRRGGFTLAEVAVTLMVIGIGLVFVLQGLTASKLTAAQTHNRKVARELAGLTLGQIASGLYWEEMDDRLYGNYGEEGYEEWSWEVVIGDEAFSDEGPRGESGVLFDNYRYRDELEREDEDYDDSEKAVEPFEKVRIRVTFPKLGDFPNEMTLEQWMPWEQVYGTEAEDGDGDDGEEASE